VDLGEDRNMVLTLFTNVITQAQPALQLVVGLISIALVLFGTLIWYTERGDYFPQNDPACPHPDLCRDGGVFVRRFPDGSYEGEPSPFSSIPMSFWWVLVTITTVGYGDMYPITPLGYAVGAMTIMFGAVVLTLPVGVIGTTFSQSFEKFRTEQNLRRLLDEQASIGEASETPTESEPMTYDEPPVLVTELETALQNLAGAAGVPCGLVQRWEEQLKAVTRFERLHLDHPCESLERWGGPVIASLREHATQEHLGGAGAYLSLLLNAWYRLLLHTSQSYEDFTACQDREAFEATFRGPLRQAGHQTPAILRSRNSQQSGDGK